MSVNLDPKVQPHSIKDPNPMPAQKPKLSFVEKWVNSVHEGIQMEKTPCRTYCINKWIKGEKDLPTQTFEVFMEKCTKDCADLKRDAAHSWRN